MGAFVCLYILLNSTVKNILYCQHGGGYFHSFEIYNYSHVNEWQWRKCEKFRTSLSFQYYWDSFRSWPLLCTNITIVLFPEITQRHFQWWVLYSKTGKEIVNLLHIISESQTYFHKHASMRRRWKQCYKFQCRRGRTEREVKSGFIYSVPTPEIPALTSYTCWNRHPYEGEDNSCSSWPSLFHVPYYLIRRMAWNLGGRPS